MDACLQCSARALHGAADGGRLSTAVSAVADGESRCGLMAARREGKTKEPPPGSSPVLIVTGASRGIGAATAILAARRGFAVCVNYLRERQKAAEVVRSIENENGRALAVQADISSEPDVVRLFETVDRELGHLSSLVNNAATIERQTRLATLDAPRLSRTFATNVVGAFLCSREAVRRTSTRHGGKGGAIVNVSSGAARAGSPGEYIDYAASKGAIDTLTIGLAKEVAEEGFAGT